MKTRPQIEANSRQGSPSRLRALAAPLVVIAIVWATVAAWQVIEFNAHARGHRENFERAGHSRIDMLEAALVSVGHGRRQRPEFLNVVFEEITSVPDVRGVWITERDGTVIFARAPEFALPDSTTFGGSAWSREGLLVGREVDIGACPFDSSGRRRSAEAMARPMHLFLLLDRAAIDGEARVDLELRAGVVGAALIAALGTALVVRSRQRTQRLRGELEATRECERRHREWATLGAGLAHETRNPLSIIRGVADSLGSKSIDDARRVEGSRVIVDEVDRVVARINDFLQYSRPLAPVIERVALCPMFEEMARLVDPDLRPLEARLTVECGDEVVLADRGMLRQVLLNVLVNAARAIDQRGRVLLKCAENRKGCVTIEVADDGSGIDPADLDHVFEPYFTRSEGGTGLGLAIVRRIAEAHGWEATIGPREPGGAGTVVRIGNIRSAKA